MTCIVGIEVEGKVLMGSDGCASSSYNKFQYDEPKLFIKKNILFGYTTSFRFADIIQYHVEIPARPRTLKSAETDKEYLVSVVVPEIRKKLKDHGFAEAKNGRDSGGTALIGYKDKLYTLQDDFSIVRNKSGYDACGSGTYFAMGSLYTTANLKAVPFETRVEMALRAAAEHGVGVTPPFHYMWGK